MADNSNRSAKRTTVRWRIGAEHGGGISETTTVSLDGMDDVAEALSRGDVEAATPGLGRAVMREYLRR